eukprot:TRINITY_DN1909_c0_g1_i2.p1 TRINITY_DN1909_c0_g1~~TRINITY_DN1909_c0_g1_i2.p1  ORF type:complete len:638 (+),score=123.13 TRINITY_DN1909_c0_g1_i2:49-1962(+)
MFITPEHLSILGRISIFWPTYREFNEELQEEIEYKNHVFELQQFRISTYFTPEFSYRILYRNPEPYIIAKSALKEEVLENWKTLNSDILPKLLIEGKFDIESLASKLRVQDPKKKAFVSSRSQFVNSNVTTPIDKPSLFTTRSDKNIVFSELVEILSKEPSPALVKKLIESFNPSLVSPSFKAFATRCKLVREPEYLRTLVYQTKESSELIKPMISQIVISFLVERLQKLDIKDLYHLRKICTPVYDTHLKNLLERVIINKEIAAYETYGLRQLWEIKNTMILKKDHFQSQNLLKPLNQIILRSLEDDIKHSSHADLTLIRERILLNKQVFGSSDDQELLLLPRLETRISQLKNSNGLTTPLEEVSFTKTSTTTTPTTSTTTVTTTTTTSFESTNKRKREEELNNNDHSNVQNNKKLKQSFPEQQRSLVLNGPYHLVKSLKQDSNTEHPQETCVEISSVQEKSNKFTPPEWKNLLVDSRIQEIRGDSLVYWMCEEIWASNHSEVPQILFVDKWIEEFFREKPKLNRRGVVVITPPTSSNGAYHLSLFTVFKKEFLEAALERVIETINVIHQAKFGSKTESELDFIVEFKLASSPASNEIVTEFLKIGFKQETNQSLRLRRTVSPKQTLQLVDLIVYS